MACRFIFLGLVSLELLTFQLEDELFVGEGRNVVYTYARQNRKPRT
jgi:hypothetical protein